MPVRWKSKSGSRRARIAATVDEMVGAFEATFTGPPARQGVIAGLVYDAIGLFIGNAGASFTFRGTIAATLADMAGAFTGTRNREPVWDTAADLGTVVANTPFSFVVSATDPDGDLVAYTAVSLPALVSFDPDTHTISSATGLVAGSYTFTIDADDVHPVAATRIEFADIPEVVFVRGYAEREELGIYVIEPENRTEPGDLHWRTGARLQRHADLGGGNWTALHSLTYTGTLPAGVTFDSATCMFTYDGTGSGSAYAEIRLASESVTSKPFKVRVVVPTVVYGDGAAALNAAKGWGAQTVDRNYGTADNWDKAMRLCAKGSTYDAPAVFLITRGTYSTADGEDFYVLAPTSPGTLLNPSSIDHLYILGEPTAPGVAWNPPVLNSATVNFRCNQKYNRHQVIKNLQTHGFTFPVENTFNANHELTWGRIPYIGILSKIAQYDTRGTGDAIGSSPHEADTGDGYIYPETYRYVSNMFQENVGGTGSSLYHMLYVEGRPGCKLRINNHRSNAPDRICSSFQTTAFDIAILNTWVSVVKNADPAMGLTDDGRSVDLFDLHQCNYSVVYNCRAYTGQWRQTPTGTLMGCLNGPILLENRRALRGGNDVPPYPNLSWQVAAPFSSFTTLWEAIGDLTGATYTSAVPQVAPFLGDAPPPAAGDAAWQTLAGGSATIVNTNAGDWNVTLDPAAFPTGHTKYWFRLRRSDGSYSRIHNLRTYKDASTFAATNYWIYRVGVDANGFDLDSVETFVTDAYWNAVKATDLTDPENPYTYKHYWAYNTFEWLNFQYGVPTFLMRDKGMGPVRALSQGSAETYFMRANPNFQERSCHFFANNKLVYPSGLSGYSGSALFALDSSTFEFVGGNAYLEPGCLVSQADIIAAGKLPSNYPSATGPGIPTRRVVYANLGNNFDNPAAAPAYVTVPAWMPLADPRSTPVVPTVLDQVATATLSGEFSPPLDVPSLNQRTARSNPYALALGVTTDFPSSVGGTTTNGTDGRAAADTRAWIWGSRFVWDSVTMRALGIYSPHLYDVPPTGPADGKWQNQYNTVLGYYDETDNEFRVFEAPLNYDFPAHGSGFTSHLFDNTCIKGRTLYKLTQPVWTDIFEPTIAAGYLQPQVIGINLDAITADPSSVVNGAAVTVDLGRPSDPDITSASLDYHAGIDSLVLMHKNRCWFYSFGTGQWSAEQTFNWFERSDVYHNLGHYNPTSGWHVCGGGVAVHTITPTAPVIEAADCTLSDGNNVAQATWAVAHPAASAGDLLLFHIGWDDSTTVASVTAPTGPNGETLTSIAGPIASASTEVRGQAWYTVATGNWTAGTRTFTPAAAESWTATVIRVPAGEFDATTPIGASATRASATTAETTVQSPAFTAGATDGTGRLVFFGVVDTDPLLTLGTGWTAVQSNDDGAVAHGVAVRNTATSNNEAITATTWTIASDSWASIAYIVRPPGGESFDRQYDWAGISPTGVVTQLDSSRGIYHPDGQTRDICLSLHEATGWPYVVHAAGCAIPGSTESVFFHDNGWIYGLDPTRASGQQWRVIGEVPAEITSIDWCCSIPDHGCVMIGSYGGYTNYQMNNTLRVWKP